MGLFCYVCVLLLLSWFGKFSFLSSRLVEIVLQWTVTPFPAEQWMVHFIHTIYFWARDNKYKRKKRSAWSNFSISSYNALLYWIVISNLKTLKKLREASELLRIVLIILLLWPIDHVFFVPLFPSPTVKTELMFKTVATGTSSQKQSKALLLCN